MARVLKTKDTRNHRLEISTDRKEGQLIFVKGNRYAYLWANKNPNADPGCITVSGTGTLRKLAKAILAEITKE